MRVITTPLKDLLILEPNVYEDSRGYFFESYNEKLFHSLKLPTNFKQDNISKSSKGVLRGLHFQKQPYAQGKLVQVLQGAVLDVAVDIRKESENYGMYYKLVLSAENKKLLYIPEGFAHGFLTLENNTIFSYKCSNIYHKESEGGIIWNDETINIDWGIKEPILSAKDKIYADFKIFTSPF